MKNNFLILLLLVMVIGFVSAESIGTYKANTTITLYQGCDTSSYSNISAIYYPNGTVAQGLTAMTGSNNYYTYNYTKTSERGVYTVNGYCDESGVYTGWSYTFEITYSGLPITTQGTSISIIAVIFLILLGVGLVYISNTKIPEGDGRDEEGKIISISYLKHIRWLLWGGVWGIMLAVLFILSNLSLAYLPSAMVGNLLFSMYKVLFRLTIPMFIIAVIWVIVRFFQDKEFQSMIERGVDLKSEYV